MDSGKVLTKPEDEPTYEEAKYLEKIPYRQSVGSLIFIAMCSRPDIAYATI